MKELAVFLAGERIGTLVQASGLSFRYDPDYLDQPDPTPLSLSMPTIRETHGNRVALSWVNGLLPADLTVRARIAERAGVKSTHPAALLSVIGLDCPGAVQVCPVDQTDLVTERNATLGLVTHAWIGERLAQLRADEASWQVADERWSLGGGQSKFALTKDERGRWFDPRGAAASTHIIKPGVRSAKYQALNEHASLLSLRKLGVPAASSEYLDFAGQAALVVERFDRRGLGASVVGGHAEDLCQALGNQTTYERYGGPTARQIMELLGNHAGERSQTRFVEALMATYLLGAPDGHARNYSVLLRGSQVALAPLYDVASSLPYDVRGEGIMHLRKVAMTIGGERQFGMVGPEQWRRFFTANSVDQDWGFGRLRELAESLADAVSDTFRELGSTPGANELGPRYIDGVSRSCRRALGRLDNGGGARGVRAANAT